MKQLLFLLFLIIGSNEIVAQDTIRVEKEDLERLSSQINKHSKLDTNRVHLLTEYANLCFYDLDFLNGLKAANEARSISKEINYAKGEGFYLKSMSIFKQRSISAEKSLKGSSRIRAIFIKELDIYLEAEGNSILGQYTNFDILGRIMMPYGARDTEIDTLISHLQAALSYFSTTENLETVANIHFALFLANETSNDVKSNEHKIMAQNLYHTLGQSYQELLILNYDLHRLLEQGKEVKALEIATIDIYTKESNPIIKAHCAYLLSRTYFYHSLSNLQLEYLFQAEEILSEIGEKDLLKTVYLSIATVYEWQIFDSEKALEYEYKELNLRKEINYFESVAFTYLMISESLFGLKKIQDFPPEYQEYLKLGGIEGLPFFDAELLWIKARMLQSQGRSEEARLFNIESIENYNKANDFHNGPSWNCYDLAQSYMGDGDYEKAIEYASKAYDLGSEINHYTIKILSADLLSQLYERTGQKEKAYTYLKLYRSLKDENDKLNNAANRSQLEVKTILNQRQREIEQLETASQLKEQENKTQRIWIMSIAGALASLILLSFILVRNNRQKQKTNKVLETTLANLKATQAQLIQSEKMASLGELTAGIAHEIQNPLNFVNNFSEVSTELVKEMVDEFDKGNTEDVKAIANDVVQNLEKINHHGKRAADIVKGMLQHSRTSTGQKEPTDINALADEYLRLAYHGLRAKDKSFNADYKTVLDEKLPKVQVIPQDIGRVLLNLINNAFYAVDKKAKSGIVDYKPEVIVSTKAIPLPGGDRGGLKEVQISVKDNGPGIPEEIKDKIFQPFFTTKPTGQGTGLGLSLSYDIVKAHGGELTVETIIGKGSKFIISFPIKE